MPTHNNETLLERYQREHRVYEEMNMSRAERLATWLEFRTGVMPGPMPGDVQAAEELRRLSAINAELLEALKWAVEYAEATPVDMVDNLKSWAKIGRAAISKAQGEQP